MGYIITPNQITDLGLNGSSRTGNRYYLVSPTASR
jgi:hypothetical protein